jgi:hypothetical protein
VERPGREDAPLRHADSKGLSTFSLSPGCIAPAVSGTQNTSRHIPDSQGTNMFSLLGHAVKQVRWTAIPPSIIFHHTQNKPCGADPRELVGMLCRWQPNKGDCVESSLQCTAMTAPHCNTPDFFSLESKTRLPRPLPPLTLVTRWGKIHSRLCAPGENACPGHRGGGRARGRPPPPIVPENCRGRLRSRLRGAATV